MLDCDTASDFKLDVAAVNFSGTLKHYWGESQSQVLAADSKVGCRTPR